MKLIRALRAFICEEEGLAAIEYVLIASLVAVAAITGATTLGNNLNAAFTNLAGRLSG